MAGAEVTIKVPLDVAVEVKRTVTQVRDQLANTPRSETSEMTHDEREAVRKRIALLSDALLRF